MKRRQILRTMINDKTVAVIGGGAAGMMAAGAAAENGNQVTLIEKNPTLGKKLLITGKGRCNVTNNCEFDEFFENIPVNPRFLYSAYSRFSSKDTMDFFEGMGVKLKTERGKRVFPLSDRAVDIVSALRTYIQKTNIEIIHCAARRIITKNAKVSGIELKNNKIVYCDSVILTTGGKSYPATGSTGDGYIMAQELGHTIIEPRASLVPLEALGDICLKLQGLSLKNIEIKISDESGKICYSDFGEMIFTHFGVSGPVILSASSHIRDIGRKNYCLEIDLKPALSEDILDKRLLRDFEKYSRKEFSNCLIDLLPSKLIPVIVQLSNIPADKKVSEITRVERAELLKLLKSFRILIKGLRPIDEAVITSGGIKTTEIDPKTMESKIVKGLYFAGEIIDVDGYTGGFNLQIAFSTGHLAGFSV